MVGRLQAFLFSSPIDNFGLVWWLEPAVALWSCAKACAMPSTHACMHTHTALHLQRVRGDVPHEGPIAPAVSAPAARPPLHSAPIGPRALCHRAWHACSCACACVRARVSEAMSSGVSVGGRASLCCMVRGSVTRFAVWVRGLMVCPTPISRWHSPEEPDIDRR